MRSGDGKPGRLLPIASAARTELEEMELRSAIQAIAIEHRLRYGYRRVNGGIASPWASWRIINGSFDSCDSITFLSLRRSAFVSTTDSDHELRGPPEPGEPDATQRHQSAVGSRHHVRPLATGICLSGDHSGCFLSQGGRLGAGSIAGGATCDRCSADRPSRTESPRPGWSITLIAEFNTPRPNTARLWTSTE